MFQSIDSESQSGHACHVGEDRMNHGSRKSASLPTLFGSVHNQMRRLAVVAAGVVVLAVGGFGAGPASSLSNSQTLSSLANEQGGFEFEIFPLPRPSGPTFLLKGGDGNLWFSNIGRHEIARFDIRRHQLRTFPLHPTSQVLVMSNGPDGNVWYADFDGNRGVIARITPTGKITEFVMPHGRGAAGLGPGRDGNIWITEGVNDRLARFDLRSQTFTEFKLPHPASGPCKVAAGPDGAIWFTELGAGRIGRITMAGKITEFEVPTKNAQPFMIVRGPDGALWFTEYNAGKIGRITTDGEFTEYPTSGVGTAPMHIVVAPGKDLWFTEAGGNALGRITMKGELTEFTFGGVYTNPDGITVGSDKRIWFTQFAADALGTVVSPR
jgi:virginiamycin B lyase